MKTFALIPAAGKSTRMGRPKLSLPLGDRTVLEHVIGALRAAGIEHILVVVGPHVPELVPLAERAGALVTCLSFETPDMRATIMEGVKRLAEFHRPDGDDLLMVLPADHAAIRADLVRQLLQARAMNPNYSIIIPTYQGRRGHPTLIDWKHAWGMDTLPAGQGLNAYLRQHEAETLELPVLSEAVVLDLDTPADLEQLRINSTSFHRNTDDV